MDKEFKCLWKQFNWTNLKPDFVVRNVILSGTINNQIFQCNFRYDPRTVVTLVCKTPVSKHVTFWRIIFIRIKSDYSESTGKKSNRTNKQTPLTESLFEGPVRKARPGALSNSQNWPARPWPDQTFWQWNRLFSRGFTEKQSPFVHHI